MKRYWLIVAIAVVTITSCKLLNKLTQFYISYNTSYSYPEGLPVNVPANTPTPDIETDIQQKFKNNNTNSDLVQSVKLDKLVLTITPDGKQTFSFLNRVDIYITAPGLAETLVAYKYGIDNAVGNTLDLDVTDAELKQYLTTDSFGLHIKSVTDETISSGITVNVSAKFFVDAKILGI